MRANISDFPPLFARYTIKPPKIYDQETNKIIEYEYKLYK